MPTAIWRLRSGSSSAHCDLALAIEVRQCPLRSGACGGSPAVLQTGPCGLRLRSGVTPCNLALAVEVW